MSEKSSTMLLMGVGGAGCRIARRIVELFNGPIKTLLVDTDDKSFDNSDSPCLLLGGERLSGRGAGGEIVSARMAAEDSMGALDKNLAGIRLACIVTGLGGGTGSGATYEIAKHLKQKLGIACIVFATRPFSFEGEARHRNSRGMIPMIAEVASASFFQQLDKLAQNIDNMEQAMAKAIETLAASVTLFWRLIEKPGYIRLDSEKMRKLVQGAGRGRFASVTFADSDRARKCVDALSDSRLLSDGTNNVKSMLCGVLAGDDLRLSEIAQIAQGVQIAYGTNSDFELATVNDEESFSGTLSVVLMLFENSPKETLVAEKPARGSRKTRSGKNALAASPQGRGRFNNSAPTIWRGEDLDIPTYLRQNIILDF
ncbi:MAG: hypothetical protein IJQ34_06465 [Kiritimatiellae bacterium]|nr:hypothetical protein [Kiritimatiellia bacterium]